MDSPNNVYKLTNGKTKGGWQLPLSEVDITKYEDGKDVGLRRIRYVKGVKSFFKEDQSGDLKPLQIWFDNGELIVPKVDKLTNELLRRHPWYGKFYELYDANREADKKLSELRVKGEARKLIEESDKEKLKAIALAIFGINAFAWGDSKCELELLKYADTNPTQLQNELKSKDYESKYLAALAFSQNIVTTNPGKTTVIWNDSTKGVILRLAKGESGIHKLGELLSTRTDESELILQEIGARLDKKTVKVKKSQSEIIKEQKRENARLKAELKALKASKTAVKSELVEATEIYKKWYLKEVPVNKKNDLEWILQKNKEIKENKE